MTAIPMPGTSVQPPFEDIDSPLTYVLDHPQSDEEATPQGFCLPKDKPFLCLLPATYLGKSHRLHALDVDDEASVRRFLDWELNVPRLNEIHDFLWLAGRPMGARSIHRQAMLGRAIVITEQVDLHLVRQESRIFVKPMPDFLLSSEFWQLYLCKDRELFECAQGFLVSYLWLVCSKSDLRMAQREDLLSSEITWDRWRRFSRALLAAIDIDGLQDVNKRYHYGELRLSRLNWIYRLFSSERTLTSVIRGYMYGYNQYSDVLQRNFAWVLVAAVYVTIVLTAMQVGLATDKLGRSDMFQNASYGFTVFSILAPLIILAVITINLLGLSIFNIGATVALKNETQRARERIVADAKHQNP